MWYHLCLNSCKYWHSLRSFFRQKHLEKFSSSRSVGNSIYWKPTTLDWSTLRHRRALNTGLISRRHSIVRLASPSSIPSCDSVWNSTLPIQLSWRRNTHDICSAYKSSVTWRMECCNVTTTPLHWWRAISFKVGYWNWDGARDNLIKSHFLTHSIMWRLFLWGLSRSHVLVVISIRSTARSSNAAQNYGES